MGRAVCLLLALCLGGVAARCVRDGWDRLGRAPLTNALNISRRALTAESEQELLQFLSGEYETQASDLCNTVNIAEWNFNTDLGNPANEEAYNTATLALAEFEKKQWEAHFKDVSIETVQDASLKRQLKYLQSLGTSALSKDRLELLNKYLLQMQNIYSTAKICPYDKKDCDLKTEGLNLDPGIEEVITTSRDYDVLTHLWTAWHDASGKLMRGDYKEYVTLSNEAATANNFEDMGKMWQASYEVDDFMTTIDSLWSEVKPLYQELHTYTLNRLRKVYGENIPKDKNLIPGHLLGNMWGQTWINLYDLLVPYPEASSYDVTASLVDQKYDAKKMFETADDFYKSMGLKPNDMCYGDKAMITKPADREVTCHASAWDFCDKKDFRIKMCTKINQDDFRTIHHEMGHIQYYQQYAPLPYVLRTGANPGFHEAIGDTIALSVDTPKHLKKVGLLVDSDFTDTKESRVNALMKMALEKVAFLPFGLLVDKWRWEVFAGLSEDRWNARWWELKNEYQMLSSPVPRSEADFDPGAKYHVPADSKYISYFVAHILEFQFYKALCIEAKQYDPTDPNGEPLHTCDFYQSKEAGKKLAEGLEKGASVHWKETLQVMTGETEMTGQALMEYFKPLYEFLKEANREGETTTSAPTTPATTAAPTTPATIAAPTTPAATSAAPTTPATSEAPTTPATPAAPTTPVPSPKPGSAVTFAPVTIITILIPLCLLHFTDSWLSY